MKKILISLCILTSAILVGCEEEKKENVEKVEIENKISISLKEGNYQINSGDYDNKFIKIDKKDDKTYIINYNDIKYDEKTFELKKNQLEYLIFIEGNKIKNEDGYSIILEKEQMFLEINGNKFKLNKMEENIDEKISYLEEKYNQRTNKEISNLAKKFYENNNPEPKDNIIYNVVKINDYDYNILLCYEKDGECLSENLFTYNILDNKFENKYPFIVKSNEEEKVNEIDQNIEEKLENAINKVKLYYDAEYGIYDGLNFKIGEINDLTIEVIAYENYENNYLNVGTYYYKFDEDKIIE